MVINRDQLKEAQEVKDIKIKTIVRMRAMILFFL